MKLYDMPLSGNCYKIRLMLSLLGKEYDTVAVDLKRGGHQTPSFLKLNPRGQVPVLEDGDTVIWDSTAILIYLARRYGSESWLPLEAREMAEVTQWLAVAQNEILYGLARARAIILFKRPWDMQQCRETGLAILPVMEQHLQHRHWLALDRPTIADIACYPYVALAPEGGIALDDYPAIRAWIKNIEHLPGYVAMTGISP
ncbi:MAG: glutathione S-transferase family protein [Gammaproteobacteria bacterium]|nr:glutathione S-transferase family protein [Gammaproteobacteria bacterium]